MSNILVPEAPRLLIPPRHQAAAKTVDYNELDIGGMSVDEVSVAQLEFHLAKKIGAVLMEKYPGRQWTVYMNCESGICQIGCPTLSTEYAYVLHLAKHGNLHELTQAAVKACGEILERYSISRNVIFDKSTIDALPRDAADNAISPDATPTIWVGARPSNKKHF